MTEHERARRALAVKLEGVLGMADAATLLEHLPPFAWDRLATKDDVQKLAVRLDQRLEGMDQRFERVGNRLDGVEQGLVALRQDFAVAQARNEVRFTQVRDELTAVFRAELVAAVSGQTRSLLIGLVSTSATFAAALVGVVALLLTLR